MTILNKFTDRIQQTGEIKKNDFMFKHIVFTEEELKEIQNNMSLKDIANTLNVDFISIVRNDSIDFIHVSNIKYTYYNDGLKAGRHIGDLGKGIYVINKNDPEAIDNLFNFLTEQYESDDEESDEELTIITGTYKGEFTECIYGYGHRGYIVLNCDEIKPEYIDVDIIDTIEFEYRYMQ